MTIPKTTVKTEDADVSVTIHQALQEHPEVKLVLDITAQAQMTHAHVQPIEIEVVSDLTVTPTISQLPGL